MAASRRAAKRSTMTVERQLTIKMGVLKRTSNDLTVYAKEVEQEQARLEGLIASGADEADLKHQRAVIEEAAAMMPDSLARIEMAVADLEAFLEENRGDASLAGSSAVREAEELLAEHSDGLEEAAAAEAAEEAMADDGDEMGDD